MTLSDRVVSADVLDHHYIAATADKNVHIFDLNNPSAPVRTISTNPLKHMTRSVKIFHDRKIFAVSSIEGRCAIKTINAASDGEIDPLKNQPICFTFRGHRDEQAKLIHPINFIETHPSPSYSAVFATGGGDGTVNLWNRQERAKLTVSFTKPLPAVDGRWNATGDLFLVANSYDWSKGQEFYNKDAPNTITVRHMTEADFRTPPPKKK